MGLFSIKRKKPSKRKKKIEIKQRAEIRDKGDIVRNDTLHKAPTKIVLPTNGITFKVKIRKK